MSGARSDAVWTAKDTSPGEVEKAITRLVVERHAEDEGYVPARALNLVCVVDRDWSGEIANRLRHVGRYHASRTVVCAIEGRGRTTIDAMASVSAEGTPGDEEHVLLRETIVVTVGETHIDKLHSIVDPLVVPDLATVVWSPHGHPEAVDELIGLCQAVLFDSVAEPDEDEALQRAAHLSEHAYVVDLAWLRTTPWRERIAAYFDPPAVQPLLRRISGVTVRHGPGSDVAALLVLGWLSSRLGWKPSSLVRHGGARSGRARAGRQDVELELEAVEQDVPGLSGITVATTDGATFALDRAPGGLTATRRAPDGQQRTWTVVGASRGEGGILGEGIRQALLRDPTYRPALGSARVLAS
jgi:glucose-6-phosphate dehydrogenase assembly protein OpcA